MSKKGKRKSVLEDVLRNDEIIEGLADEVVEEDEFEVEEVIEVKKPQILYSKENIASTAVDVDELRRRLDKIPNSNYEITVSKDPMSKRDIGWVVFRGGKKQHETCTIMQPVEITVRRAYEYFRKV